MKLVVILAVVALSLAGAAKIALHNQKLAQRKYGEWKYPAQKGESKYAADIKRDVERRKHNEVARKYQKVMKKLHDAEREGKKVAWLKAKMPRVIRLLKEKKYHFAKIHLNTIDIRIPRKLETVLPASSRDHNEKMTGDLQGREKKIKKREKKRRGGRRGGKKRRSRRTRR